MASSSSDAAPRPGPPPHGFLWRAASHIPLLGSLLWLSDDRHSCDSAPFDPASPALAPSLGRRFVRSATTGLLVHHRTWAAAGGGGGGGGASTGGAPRAVAYLLHGYAEHCGRYEHVAAALAGAGITVHALDHQGCGESEGDRAHFGAFADCVADVLQLVRVASPPPPGVPAFLLGHSMGGLMALHVAHAAAGAFAGAVISGPALVVDPSVDNALNRFLASSLSSVLPKLEVQALDAAALSTDAAVVAQYARDPLVYHGAMRVRVGYEMMQAMAAVRAWAGELSLPLLVLHGEADALCRVEGSRWLMTALTACPDKTLRTFPRLFHEIFNEREGGDIVRGAGEWMLAHAGAK